MGLEKLMDKEYLGREDIDLVKFPQIKKLALEAWERGEEVPYGVIYIDLTPLSEEDLTRIRQLVKEGKIIDI